MGPIAGCTLFVIGCGAGLFANLIFGSESKFEQQYMREQQRAKEAEDHLFWAARFGCNKRENLYDLIAEGWTVQQLVKLDVQRRHKKDEADMELRFEEGTPTLQDVKWRKRIQDEKRCKEEAARHTKELQEREAQEMRERQMREERNHRQNVEARLADVQHLLRESLNIRKRRDSLD